MREEGEKQGDEGWEEVNLCWRHCGREHIVRQWEALRNTVPLYKTTLDGHIFHVPLKREMVECIGYKDIEDVVIKTP